MRQCQNHRKKNFLKQQPGVEKSYSNVNAALAALIVENATGVPFKTYVKDQILL